MLTRFFHRWEHQLASVTKDRVVRPFDWGLDWIPVNGHSNASPGARVHAWVDEVMRDTGVFFDVPPTRAYQFDPPSPRFGDASPRSFSLPPAACALATDIGTIIEST